jgi:hypothetical protein
MAEQYRVRIKRGVLEVEVESTDREYVDAKVSDLIEAYSTHMDGDEGLPSAKTNGSSGSGTSGDAKRTSLQEFVKKLAPSKDTEYVVAVTYYAEKHEGLQEVRTRDVSARFRSIKYKHSNPADAVARARKQAFLMEGSSRRTFVVTQTGEKWVEGRLGGGSNEPT